MDKNFWDALLEFLKRALLMVPHPILRFFIVFAAIITAFLLQLASLTGGNLNQPLFVGAFVILILVFVFLGAYFIHVDQVERRLEREMNVGEKLKSRVRDRIQEETEQAVPRQHNNPVEPK